MKIAYWATCSLEPEIEAVSKEVATLAEHFRPSFVFSVNSQLTFRLSLTNRSIGFRHSLDPWFRPLIQAMETCVDISHVYGDVTPWVYRKSLGKKPIIHTIASEKGTPDTDFLDRCSAVIVQTEGMHERLLELGCSTKKVHLLYPGVDVATFKPAIEIPPLSRPRVLFATAPRSKEELEPRGVFLLIEAARLNPANQFHLLFRPWSGGYTSLEAVQQRLGSEELTNVSIRNVAARNMADIYRAHHFTSIPYTRHDGGKECPNSLVESLACGVPVLITDISPFSAFVERHGCGIVHPPTPEGLIAALEKGMEYYDRLRLRARAAAESCFDLRRHLAFHEHLYLSLA
mgnify:CR=1 FL=1